jgi:hypothetical protein
MLRRHGSHFCEANHENPARDEFPTLTALPARFASQTDAMALAEGSPVNDNDLH